MTDPLALLHGNLPGAAGSRAQTGTSLKCSPGKVRAGRKHLIYSVPATSLAGNAEKHAYCLVYKNKMEETSLNGIVAAPFRATEESRSKYGAWRNTAESTSAQTTHDRCRVRNACCELDLE